MCERFGCLPSALLAEDSQFLQMIELESLIADEEEVSE